MNITIIPYYKDFRGRILTVGKITNKILDGESNINAVYRICKNISINASNIKQVYDQSGNEYYGHPFRRETNEFYLVKLKEISTIGWNYISELSLDREYAAILQAEIADNHLNSYQSHESLFSFLNKNYYTPNIILTENFKDYTQTTFTLPEHCNIDTQYVLRINNNQYHQVVIANIDNDANRLSYHVSYTRYDTVLVKCICNILDLYIQQNNTQCMVFCMFNPNTSCINQNKLYNSIASNYWKLFGCLQENTKTPLGFATVVYSDNLPDTELQDIDTFLDN